MDQEVGGCLPFLDVLISKKDDGSFTHEVFQKKTHTEQYLHAKSHHFPTQKLGVLNTLATHALIIFDENHLNKEKAHLLNVFVKNGYSGQQGLKAFLKAGRGPKVKKDPIDRISGVHLPFIHGTTHNIVRILRKHNVPSTFRPINSLQSCLRSVKDPVDAKDMKGVYVIPCSCGTPYAGETRCFINQRIHEQATEIKHGRDRS